jgi:protein O-GlcNAc transferase
MDLTNTLLQAMIHHKDGDLEGAEKLYRSILTEEPKHPDTNHNLGILLKQGNQADFALSFFKTALESDPNQDQFWISYIDTLIHLGQLDAARKILKQGQSKGLKGDAVDQIVIRLNSQPETTSTTLVPSKAINPERLLSRAKSHAKQGETQAARELYKQVLDAYPQNQQAKKGLKALQKGQVNKKNPSSPPRAQVDSVIALYSQGQIQETLTASEALIKDYPNEPLLYNISGACYTGLGQLDAAVKSFEQALTIKPDYADAHNNLGTTLRDLDQWDAAVKSYEKALTIKPDFAEAHSNLGITFKELGQLEAAVKHYEQALTIKPDYADAHFNLAITLTEFGQLDAAVKHYEKAIAIEPDNAKTHYNLGNVLQDLAQLDAAVKHYEQAIAIEPDNAETHCNLGNTLQDLGQLDAAVKRYEEAFAIKTDYPIAHNNLLFALNYHPDLSAEDIFKSYQEYDQRFGLPYRHQWKDHSNQKDLTRLLKIGYVSPDFRVHSMKNFLAPLLDHHNRDDFEIYAYAEIINEDEMTEFYKNSVDHWIKTNSISDDALSELIRSHEIDILIDLAGHSKGNRLGVFARKPAPVSVSMFGYGYTTGLTAIDYFVGDETMFPEGSEHLFSEQTFPLKPGLSYRPAEGMGEVNTLPALDNGYVTFGTLTRSVRINHKTIQVWSAVLKQVKGSKLILNSKSFVDPDFQKTMASRFLVEGISRDRLVMGSDSPPWDVLRQIDISFDCFPHNSGTTLFESLYMGTPFVTLAGRPSVGRIGATVLTGAHHPEWIAETENEYIEKAVALASDLPELVDIRRQLRDEMQSLPFMDETLFVKKLEQAYRQMWQQWC